jgi:hypothetical protein
LGPWQTEQRSMKIFAASACAAALDPELPSLPLLQPENQAANDATRSRAGVLTTDTLRNFVSNVKVHRPIFRVSAQANAAEEKRLACRDRFRFGADHGIS